MLANGNLSKSWSEIAAIANVYYEIGPEIAAL
jgi:hypothetical protein